jgi:putative tricarboxylic transport membrane protein
VEYFWLAMLGISTLASLTAKNMAKGLMAGLIGIFLSLVGLDPLTGTDRFSFGIARLTSGVSIVPVIIAMFAVPQLLKFLEGQVMEIGPYTPRPQVGFQVAGTMLRRMKLLLLKSSVIGTIIGIVPGAGGYVASLVAYTEAKGSSAAPDEFGHGKMEGVVAAEAANSATAGGAIIPTLTFGIPGSNITAVLIGALMLHGFEPGPDLFLSQGPLLVAFIITLYFSYLVMLVFGAVGPKYFSLFLKVRSNYVVASFLVVSVIGTYSMSSNMIDVYLMLLLGLAGYVVQKVNIPLAPVVLGLILGPLAEKGLRHGLELGPLTGSVWGYFFLRPLSMVLIVLIVLFMTLPIYRARRRKAAALSRAEGECRAESHGAEKRKPMDFALAGVMTALSLAGLASLGDYTPEARIFPVFCFCGFLACSALLVAMNLGRKGWAGPDQGGWGGLPGVPWAKFGLVSVLYFLFVLGMPWIGFMASGTLFMLAVAYIADNEAAYKARPGATAARYVGFSILSAVAIYLVFIKTLNLDLPMRLMDYLFG